MADHDEIDRLLARLTYEEYDAAKRELLKIGEPALHRLLQLPLFGGSGVFRWEDHARRWDGRDARDWLPNVMGALTALARENLDAFLDAIRESDRTHNWIIISVLSEIRTLKAVDILLESIRGRDSLLRQYAAQGLWRSRSPRAVEPLIKALSDRAWEVRFTAVQAMCGLGDERALEPLKRMLSAKSNAKHPGIREYAARAIARIEARLRAGQSRRPSRRNEPPGA
jgi:hypothetical protein